MTPAADHDTTIRIVMIEDHALLRGALAQTLSNEPDLVIAGECSSVDEALALIASQKVDIVLLDINLGLLYQEKAGRLLSANDRQGAREAALKAARYMTANPQAQMTAGLLSYATGDKTAALEALLKAKSGDPENFKRRFDQAASRPAYKSILDDKEFLARLFP